MIGNGSAVKRAFVAVIGQHHRAVAVTSSSGAFRVAVPDGQYRLASNAPGFKAKVIRVALNGRVSRNVELAGSGLTLHQAPVFGGGNQVVADGTPGVFYVAGDNVGGVFRTVDWGGTWTPVTVRDDDHVNGIQRTTGPGYLTTSGVPGEVAVSFFNGGVLYSKDYGVTWHAIAGAPEHGNQILWGHAGGESVLLLVFEDMYVADMNSANPRFVKMTRPYAGSGGPVAVANGSDRPWVATIDSAGHLLVYPLLAQAQAPAAAVDAPGFDGSQGREPPEYLALGGSSAPGAPPSGVLVGGLYWVGMSLKDPAAKRYPAPTVLPVGVDIPGYPPGGSTCWGDGPLGGFAVLTPNTSARYGAGWLAGCWVQDVAGVLTVTRNAGSQPAIDAGYDATNTSAGTDAVMLADPGNRNMFSSGQVGVAKLTATNAGVPVPLANRTTVAKPGRDPGAAGIAETGITAGVVHQTAFMPGGIAAATDVGGAASDDGGASFQRTTYGNVWSVASWQGASGNWLLFGQNAFGTNLDLVAAFRNWTHTTPPVQGGNVVGSTASDFAGYTVPGGVVHVDAIAGIPGEDKAFVGATFDGTIQNGPPEAAVERVTLAPGPQFTDQTKIAPEVITKPGPLAYCPVAGSAASLQNALIVVSEDYLGGGLFKVTDATGSPAAKEIQTFAGTGTGNGLPALRVDCASGTIWAASGDPGDGLIASTDGGQSFTHVPVPNPGGGVEIIRALGMTPGIPSQLIVGDADGYLQSSDDAGRTWTLVNDPATDLDLAAPPTGFSGGIWDIIAPPASSPTHTADAVRTRASGPAGADVIAGPGEFTGRPRTQAIPQLTAVGVTRRRFKVTRHGTPTDVTSGRGTTVQLSVSLPGTASITVSKLTPGRRVGARCVTRTRHNARRPPCTQATTVAKLKAPVNHGANGIAFTGWIGRTQLRPGQYRLTIAAQIGRGQSSTPRIVQITILRG